MKHTPGPWTIRAPYFDEPRRGNLRIVAKLLEDGTQDPIAEVSAVKDTFAESASNARLIAAAPDLLAACKAAQAVLTDGHEVIWQKLTAAIAKAEGGVDHEECQTCLGHGRIEDADTGAMRKCLDCTGTGKIAKAEGGAA